jgi:hypothetical protein
MFQKRGVMFRNVRFFFAMCVHYALVRGGSNG